MIPCTHPYEAVFRIKKEGQKDRFEEVHIIAWDDDGQPLIAGTHKLIYANSYPNFEGIQEADGKIIAVIPGGGYLASYAGKHHDGEVDEPFEEPVLAWTINEFGQANPISVDCNGFTSDVTDSSNFTALIIPKEFQEPEEEPA